MNKDTFSLLMLQFNRTKTHNGLKAFVDQIRDNPTMWSNTFWWL